jgi:hypothetical protein
MAQITITGYSILNGVASIVTAEAHNLSVGDYISVRNVNSNVNGQYFITSTPVDVTLTYAVPGAPNTLATNVVGGYLITTTINQAGKPAFVYDESADTWYQISGKVNTNGNYTWTGTHLFQAPVTMEDLLVLSNLSASVSASPVGGGFIYVESGALKFKGGNGTITTIAPA